MSSASLFYIPISSVWESKFLHILINTWYYPLFILFIVILVGMMWYLIVVLNHIFLNNVNNNKVRYLFVWLLAICIYIFSCFLFVFLLLRCRYSVGKLTRRHQLGSDPMFCKQTLHSLCKQMLLTALFASGGTYLVTPYFVQCSQMSST